MMMILSDRGRLKRSCAEASVTSEGLLSALCAQRPTHRVSTIVHNTEMSSDVLLKAA